MPTQSKVHSGPNRVYLPNDIVIDSWAKLSVYYEDLANRSLDTVDALRKWLTDYSELNAVVSEDVGWRYIISSCDTTDAKAKADYEFFVNELQPYLAPYDDALNKKLLNAPLLESFLKSCSAEERTAYDIFLRMLKKQVEIYRPENIPLFTQIQTEDQKYAEIVGKMTIDFRGKELTMQQASVLLRENDRQLREDVFVAMNERRMQDEKELDDLFTTLVKLRHQVATNAGFSNFRDYMFAALGRFDYTVDDCFNFHRAIAEEIIPLNDSFDASRKKALKLDELKPWDGEVDVSGKPPLNPHRDGEELLQKTISCFTKIHPYFGECIQTMKDMKRLDLESRKGKAPGGYNYPLYESGVPFIFMNSAGSLRDVITMVHEGGHAVHSFLTRPIGFTSFKDTPSEVSELASMSMELLSLAHWDIFLPDAEELRRAKLYHLEKIVGILPWIATIDKFQHWIYTNPNHDSASRTKAWKEIAESFSGKEVSWSGQERYFNASWQKQLHLYQVPFYYIEYGMAQLGAIAVWRNYKQNPEKAIQQYKEALKLGYTKSIGDIYKTAGIRFDFSKEYIHELVDFVKTEISAISQQTS